MSEWFEIPKVFIVAGITLILANILGLVGRGRRGLWKLGLKEAMGTWSVIVGMVWVLFAAVTGVFLISEAARWVDGFQLKYTDPQAIWVIRAIPEFLTITLLLFLVGTFVWITKTPWIKYTEEERGILKEEKRVEKVILRKLIGKKEV